MIHRFFLTVVIWLAAAATLLAGWKTYEDCVLREDRYFDGDSFYVKVQEGSRERTYIFRLYGVDCPETDDRYPERLQEQAEHFNVPVKEITRWGERASAFARKFLRRPFTVHTKKEEARGESRQNRYFAIIENADGDDLGVALLEAGLARAYGMPTAWPESATEDFFRRTLDRKEKEARKAGAGIWGIGESKTRDSIFTKPLPFQSPTP